MKPWLWLLLGGYIGVLNVQLLMQMRALNEILEAQYKVNATQRELNVLTDQRLGLLYERIDLVRKQCVP